MCRTVREIYEQLSDLRQIIAKSSKFEMKTFSEKMCRESLLIQENSLLYDLQQATDRWLEED